MGSKSEQKVIEASAIRLVKDGRVCATLECDEATGDPVLRMFKGDVPAVQLGVQEDAAFLRIGGQPGAGCIRIEYQANLATQIIVEAVNGPPAVQITTDSAGGRMMYIYDQNMVPLYFAGLHGLSQIPKAHRESSGTTSSKTQGRKRRGSKERSRAP